MLTVQQMHCSCLILGIIIFVWNVRHLCSFIVSCVATLHCLLDFTFCNLDINSLVEKFVLLNFQRNKWRNYAFQHCVMAFTIIGHILLWYFCVGRNWSFFPLLSQIFNSRGVSQSFVVFIFQFFLKFLHENENFCEHYQEKLCQKGKRNFLQNQNRRKPKSFKTILSGSSISPPGNYIFCSRFEPANDVVVWFDFTFILL